MTRGRRKNKTRVARSSPAPLPAPQPEQADIESNQSAPVEAWRWKTFPVGFAFALGALTMGALVWLLPGAFYVLLVTAFFFAVFGVAHFFGRTFREYRDLED